MGSFTELETMIAEDYGGSLGDELWRYSEHGMKISFRLLLSFAKQAVSLLERLHRKGFIHSDIRPQTLVLGKKGSSMQNILHLLDFGTTTDEDHHYAQNFGSFSGKSLLFASVNAHLGRALSRRDDLESLAYTLAWIINGGTLPWDGLTDNYSVFREKTLSQPDDLFGLKPCPIKNFYQYVINLGFDDEPDYLHIVNMFGFCEERPKGDWEFRMHFHLLMGKRLLRSGHWKGKWVTTLMQNDHSTRQTVCANVSGKELKSVIKKHRKKGFYIKHIFLGEDSRKDSWCLVFGDREADGVTAEEWMITKRSCIAQDIHKKYKEGYSISAMCCRNGGDQTSSSDVSVMVSMKKLRVDDEILEQGFCHGESFCGMYGWIRKMWAKNMGVVSLTASRSDKYWGVGMARMMHVEQVAEIDMGFPYDGVRQRQKQGYSVSCSVASKKMCVVILSRIHGATAGKCAGRTETVVSSDIFPQRYIEEEGVLKNRYVSSLCYAYAAT